MRRFIRLNVFMIFIWTTCVVLFLFVTFPDAFHNDETRHAVKVPAIIRKRPYNLTSSVGIRNTSNQYWFRNFKHKHDYMKSINDTKFEIDESSVDYVVSASGKYKIMVVNKTIKVAGKKPEPVKRAYEENTAQVVRMRREDNERRYYKPRKTRVNPIDTDFLISGAQICSTDAKYMTILVIVPSIPSHIFVRDAIRSTYGSYAKHPFQIELKAIDVTTRLLFLVGRDGYSETDRIVRNESRKYGDIVFADFKESYRNLTRKMLIALKWVSVYCSDVDFVMKVDEDVFVNIPQLATELHSRPYGIKGSVYGNINLHSSVHRKGKWAVSRDEFPLTHYPSYASGNSYVISGNMIPRMFMISEYMPYMPIEDAFITGCLARIVEANVVSVPGFTFWDDMVPIPCLFVKEKRISATKVTTSIMSKLWNTCNLYKEMCIDRPEKVQH